MAWDETMEPDAAGGSKFWRLLRIFATGIALCFLIGIAAGFTVATMHNGHGITLKWVLVTAGLLLGIAGCVWQLRRDLKRPAGEEPLRPKERMNRNILIACGIAGFVTAITLALAVPGGITEGSGVFSNDPLPPLVAGVLVIVLGIFLPAIGFYWHRIVDEQETDAYKTGALWGIYVYGIGAPLWWLAWRGGFVPEPNGFVIYYATITTLSLVWLWKKYR